MSDRARFLAALEEVGSRGLHSHDVRRQGLSGHPSERAAELERQGYEIRRVRENVGRRPGVRFFLISTLDSNDGINISTGSAGVGAGRRAGQRSPAQDVKEPMGLCRRASEPQSASADPGEPQLFEYSPLNPLGDQEAA